MKRTIKPKKNFATIRKNVWDSFMYFISSIYGRVVFSAVISLFILFLFYGFIFRSVNERYMQSVISESGNNVGYLVESALYHAMLENDQASLQRTLDLINDMSGIDEVNMYDSQNNLAYTSISPDSYDHVDPDCISCHKDMDQMFSRTEKSYRIIDLESECAMNPVDHDNSRHLMIKSPILNDPSCSTNSCHAHSPEEKVLGSLIIQMPLAGLDGALEKSTNDYYMLASSMTFLLIVFLLIFTHKKIRNPLHEIVRASEAVSKGNRNTRLPIKHNHLEDMKMVAAAFNEMLDNLHAANNELKNWSQQLEYKVQKKSEELGQVQNELIRIERIASLGKLSLSVAHEINNPLSGILVYTKLIQKQIRNHNLPADKKEKMLKNLNFIEAETKRCGEIVKGLLDFSRKDQEGFEPKKLHEILSNTYELMAHPMKIRNIHFWTDFSARNDLIYCSPNQIKQACVAIMVNASEAVDETGEIIVRTYNPDEDHLCIEVQDNGVGISKDDLPYVFEPFYSTKEKMNGTGLGLAIVHGIIENHKGKINIKSEPGKQTTVIITLPLIKHLEDQNNEKQHFHTDNR